MAYTTVLCAQAISILSATFYTILRIFSFTCLLTFVFSNVIVEDIVCAHKHAKRHIIKLFLVVVCTKSIVY